MHIPLLGGHTDAGAKRHERVTVDEKTRMWLNGESAHQMTHAKAIKHMGGVHLEAKYGNDTSVDQKWEYHTHCRVKCADTYVLITTVLWMGPKLLLFAPFMLLLHLPPMLVVRAFIMTVPDGTEKIKRTGAFYALFTLTLILAIPAGALALISLLLDYVMYYVFSVPYMVLLCRWKQTSEGFAKIAPYRNGPSILLHLPDFFVCAMGQCGRQAVGETLYMISCMWLLMPWLKYYINCNPFIYDLDHRMTQQISTTMQDLGTVAEWCDTARGIISRCRQHRHQAERIDIWSFVPHYPYPPPNRRWALGMQAGGTNYPGKFTLIVHTTHASEEVAGSTEQFVLSNSCLEPCYRVMLWYSNPYHFLTGWVEASCSTGEPSQKDKYRGGEHPMWLVTAHSPMVSGRDAFTGSGMIDAFFDYWLPVFTHEMRYDYHRYIKKKSQEEALKIANDKYQEVKSADGKSVPDERIGLHLYGENCTFAAFREVAKQQGKDRTHEADRTVMGVAGTGFGEAVFAAVQGGEDVLTPKPDPE